MVCIIYLSHSAALRNQYLEKVSNAPNLAFGNIRQLDC